MTLRDRTSWSRNPEALRSIVKACPFCNLEPLANHRTWTLAAAIIGTPPAKELIKLMEEKNWRQASEIVDFDPMEDDFEYLVLFCDNTGRAAILSMLLPYEPFDEDRVFAVMTLDAEEQETLVSLIYEKGNSVIVPEGNRT